MLAGSEQNAIVPVGEARTVTAALPVASTTDALHPATQTSAVGLILPPHDIRGIADKTAQFVARNGILFEQRVKENEKDNAKFAFLREDSPYYAYYKTRVREFREGKNMTVFVAPDKKQTVKETVTVQRVLQKPEPDRYTVTVPEGLTALDLDVVKLAAQFVARNGKSFLTGLASREHSNPQFNFLKPTHSMFSFFTALCDAYSKVLMPPKDTLHKLTAEKSDQQEVLERYLRRLEWEQAREREEKEAADAAERERIAMQLIDWHDFVIVETIDFHQDEDADLPLPMTLKDVMALNKAHLYEYQEVNEKKKQSNEVRPIVPMEVKMDQEEVNLVAAAIEEEAAEVRVVGTEVVEAETDVPIKVIKNYKRMDKKPKADSNPNDYVVSPITGELVKVSEMENHMRVSLIDPRWKEQRDTMIAKIRETTKADDNEIGHNLLSLAKTRPDIFGSTQEEVSQAVKVSIREKMMSGSHRPVVWDGVTQSGQNLETQLKAIQESKMYEEKRETSSTTLQAAPAPPTIAQPPMVGASALQAGTLMRPPVAPHEMASMMAAAPMTTIRPMVGHVPMTPMPMTNNSQQPPIPEEPEPKRQRVEFVLQPEEEFMARFGGGPSKIRVQCPSTDGNEKLIGQLLEVEVESLMDSIGLVKSRLSDVIGLPANKQKLSRDGVGFLKDEFSLAHYNVGEDVYLILGVKERGGRKK